MNDKKIMVISGPSGVGKTTLYKKALAHFQNELAFSISATTRQKRESETNGKDYYFLSEEEFQQKIDENQFLEWAKVHTNYYGTLKSEIFRIWENQQLPLLDVDVQGGLNIKQNFGDQAQLIFIAPPSIEDLEARLRHRADNDEESLKIRLHNAIEELSHKDDYHHIIVNENIDNATEELITLIKHYIK